MELFYNLLIFFIAVLGGSVPLFFKAWQARHMQWLLAFSGAFLLGVSLMHLVPEAVEELGHRSGYLMLGGFFLQLFLQKFTHGAEHGHTHHGHKVGIPISSILAGMAVHAFMEGVPLGFNFRQAATQPSLYFAVAAHKLPEAFLITTLALQAFQHRGKAVSVMLIFAAITPLAAMLATSFGVKYFALANVVSYMIPIVAGAFLHIATTIFFESGSQQHKLSLGKTLSIVAGLLLALATLLFESH